MSRKLPKYFSKQFLPELFLNDPKSAFVSDLAQLQIQLNEAWNLGAQEFRETSLCHSNLEVELLDWRNHQAILIRFPRAQSQGEAEFAILRFRPATNEARILYLEKTVSGYALTSVESDRSHHYHQDLHGQSATEFLHTARNLQ